MLLSKSMMKEQNSSEVEIFRKLTAELMRTEKQLDTPYNGDRYLRDRQLTAVEIPRIWDSLRDRMPRTAQQLINRVANRLSDKPKTAGTELALHAEDDDPTENGSSAMYNLGKNYGGKAQRETKIYVFARGRRGQKGGRNLGKVGRDFEKGRKSQGQVGRNFGQGKVKSRQRRLSSKWMRQGLFSLRPRPQSQQ